MILLAMMPARTLTLKAAFLRTPQVGALRQRARRDVLGVVGQVDYRGKNNRAPHAVELDLTPGTFCRKPFSPPRGYGHESARVSGVALDVFKTLEVFHAPEVGAVLLLRLPLARELLRLGDLRGGHALLG
jgi:hypothetical protein